MLIGRKQSREDKERQRMKAARKKQDKRRKGLIRTRFGQKPLRHAKRGVYSCFSAAVVGMLLVLMVLSSIVNKGEVGIAIGWLGLFTLFMAIYGVGQGIKGLKERDKTYTTCKIGIVINGLIVVFFVAVYIRGIISA